MDYTKRLKKLQKRLQTEKIKALWITSVPNIIYLSGFTNFFPEDKHSAYLYITPDKAYYLTNPLYIEEVKATVKHFELIELNAASTLSTFFKETLKLNDKNKLGVDLDDISASEFLFLRKFFVLVPDTMVTTSRIIKEAKEISAIENACRLGDNVFEVICKNLKPEITEKQLAFIIEQYMREHNATPSFASVVCFGTSSSQMHHAPTSKKLQKNSFVLLDFGVRLNSYCSDMTRTLFYGKASEKQKKMYNTTYDAQNAAVAYIVKNMPTKKVLARLVDKAARDVIKKAGFPTFPHSLGHQIGLEVHEGPRLTITSKAILQNGMVFSIEPGIYEPGFGGVRIEDLVVIENNKPRFLTKSPRELIEIK